MLLEEYLRPRGITAETAIPLSEAPNTSPELWMGLQANHHL
jgi:plasmid maintenance system antidote protein VapI